MFFLAFEFLKELDLIQFFLAFEFLKELDLIQNLICFPWSRGLQQIRPFKKEHLPSLGLDLKTEPQWAQGYQATPLNPELKYMSVENTKKRWKHKALPNSFCCVFTWGQPRFGVLVFWVWTSGCEISSPAVKRG